MTSEKHLSSKSDDNNQTIAQPNYKVSGVKNTPAKLSYFLAPIKNTVPYKNITLSDVANAIRGDRAKMSTQTLRAIEDADKAKEFKGKGFDYVTFSGTFSQRKADALIAYSGLIALDFDHVDVDEVKSKLNNQTDVDTVLLFVSPSGDGIKWIVPATTQEEHVEVFEMYQRYCKEELGLEVDKSGKDVARACFIPYDAHAVINEQYAFCKLQKYWGTLQPQASAHTNNSQYEGTSPFDDYNAKGDVVALLQAHGWSMDKRGSTKENTMFTRPDKKSGISASFRLSDKVFYVFTDNSVFEGSKGYNPSQVFTLLNYGSLNKGAYRKAALQLIEMGYGKETTSSGISSKAMGADNKNGKLNFYSFSKNKPVIEASQLAAFYKQQNFIRISEQGNDKITVIKNTNKILKPFNHITDTIAILSQHINHPEQRAQIENELIKKRITIENSWKLLEGEPYNLHKDTKDATYFPFKNGVCKVTKSGVEMIDYKSDNITFFIDNIESQNHNFNIGDINKRGIGDFEKFLIYAIIGRETDEITDREQEDIKAFYSMIGYLINNYKDPSSSPAVILTDKDADGVRGKGGRGKSLLTRALQQVKCSKFRDASKFDPGYVHVYADLEKYHNIYILDELSNTANLGKLFADITGDITAERKGLHAVTIPFKDAPKFVITTNKIVRYDQDADSFNRRFVEFKFSYFWNDKNRPINYFKRRFFDDWDNKEWQLFFEFLVACAMQYLIAGIQNISYSKQEDNYRIYFSNDIVIQEFERILEIMKKKGSFNFTRFHNEYVNNSPFRNEKLFHKKNLVHMIEAYVDMHNIPVTYDRKTKWWTFPDFENINNADESSKLLF